MDKQATLFAALLALAGSAVAQTSTLIVYGRTDLGLVVDGGGPGGRSVRLSSGVAKGSNLGFKGTEDLGGGYRTGFVMETGYCADSAATTSGSGSPISPWCTGSNFMGRGTHVDLSAPFGGIALGRQYPVGHTYLMQVDPFGGGTAGQVLNLADVSGPYVSNAIRVTAPSVANLFIAAEVGLGELAGSWADGRETGAALIWAEGPASIGLTSYEVRNNNGQGSARRNVLLGGWYDFGVVKVHAMAQRSTGNPTGAALRLDVLDLMAGVTVPVGGGRALASYTHHDDRTARAQHADQDAHQFALGYLYPLSRRVTAYTAWSRLTNQNGGKLTVGNPTERGTGNRSANLGIGYDF